MRTGWLRLVGAGTAAYGVAVALRPDLLAKPSGLVGEGGAVSEDTAASLRPVGWRDAVSGAAMVLAPAGTPLRMAALIRIAADFGDALVLGATLPRRDRRPAAVAVSIAWGALSVAGLVSSRREPKP